jgi:hypothetical protein
LRHGLNYVIVISWKQALGDKFMEALRKIIDSKALETLFPLPKSFQNKDVEIIISPINKKRGSLM